MLGKPGQENKTLSIKFSKKSRLSSYHNFPQSQKLGQESRRSKTAKLVLRGYIHYAYEICTRPSQNILNILCVVLSSQKNM